jgi:molybdopterin synthase sulfur carrier subunit
LTIKLTYLIVVDIQKGYNLLKITVRFYGVVYEVTGVREWELSGKEVSCVWDLLELLVESFPGLEDLVFDGEGSLREYLGVWVNGRDILGLNGFDTELREGDLVYIVPPIGGG